MRPLVVLRQARVPLLLAVAVVALVIVTLRANEGRECRQLCLKHRFADGVYARERFAEGRCECVTDDGKRVPAPLAERR
jgi:hypothetical protein